MNDKDFNRVSALAGLDLDYTALKSELNSYSILAAKVAGTELSEINLLDSYTQWTVASASGNDNQKPRESAVCNYTIKEENAFETRLDLDERFKNSPYVLKEG